MWPRDIDWRALRFGVEIEILDGWTIDPLAQQFALTGERSGGEIRPPPLRWAQRGQIVEGLACGRPAGR